MVGIVSVAGCRLPRFMGPVAVVVLPVPMEVYAGPDHQSYLVATFGAPFVAIDTYQSIGPGGLEVFVAGDIGRCVPSGPSRLCKRVGLVIDAVVVAIILTLDLRFGCEVAGAVLCITAFIIPKLGSISGRTIKQAAQPSRAPATRHAATPSREAPAPPVEESPQPGGGRILPLDGAFTRVIHVCPRLKGYTDPG